MKRSLMTFASALALVACGGGDDDARPADTATRAGTSGAERATRAGSGASAETERTGKPVVTVRVEGPDPVAAGAEGEQRVGAGRYQAIVRMHNEGDAPAEIELAHVDFEAWSEDGRRIACVPIAERALDTPPLLQPDEMHELTATAVCHFPEPGEYEVRSYVSFGAEQEETDWDLARYFAGRTEVRVTSG